MPRVISFIVLLAIVLLVGAVFFQVMAQFMVPLFLACVLLVVFEPLHAWLLQRMPRWPRLAALMTTVLILLVVLVPLVGLAWKAYSEFHDLLNQPIAAADDHAQPANGGRAQKATAAPRTEPRQATAPQTDVAAADSHTITEEKKDEAELSVKLKVFVNDILKRY